MAKRSYIYRYLLCSIAVLCCGCHVEATKSNSTQLPNPHQIPEQRGSSGYAAQMDGSPFDRSVPDRLKKKWQSFTRDGRYRIAGPDDLSEEARKHIAGYVGIYLPLLYDINSDGGFDDFAIIVVDTKRDAENRFSLVIFSAPKGNVAYEVAWVFRDRDLSRSALSRASARLVVTEYRDGSQEVCFVKWDRKKSQYYCEK